MFARRFLATVARSLVQPARRGLADAAAQPAAGLRLTFASPSELVYVKQSVEMVTVPGSSGVFGILPNHVPTVAELQPGVVVVKEKDSAEKRFFVSSGFAIVNDKNELTINAVEAFPVDSIDKDAAKRAVDDYTAKLAAATTDADKGRATVGLEVARALVAAAGV